MLRLLSFLLILGGLLAAGYAGSRLLEDIRPHDAAMSEAAFEEMTVEAAPPPLEDAPAEMAAEAPTRSLSLDDDGEVSLFPESVASGSGGALEPASAATDAFIESLKTVPLAHETPASAEYKRAFDVTLAIDSTGDDTAADALSGRGNVRESEVLVSERVEARLSGANFAIVAMSPEIQTLSPLTENTWRWSVTPLTAGSHDLVFEVFAIDEDSVVPLRTFRDTVTVKVSGLNHAVAFADQTNPLFVLLGGLGSAIAGFLGAVKFVRRR